MEKEQGFKYLIEGVEDIGEFSKSILLLTNLKANNEGIVDFRTFYGSNNIHIISTIENDSYIESHVGKIRTKEECTIYQLVADDLKPHVTKHLDESLDNEEEIYFSLDFL